MKKINQLIIIGLLYSLNSFGVEKNPVNESVTKSVYKVLYKSYINGINSLAVKYNSNRVPKYYSNAFKKRYGLKISQLKSPKLLPKMIVKNSQLIIPELKITYSFSNFINQELVINGKIYKSNCKIKSECLKDLVNYIRPLKTSYFGLNSFMAFAQESADPLAKLDLTDYKLIMTVMAMEEVAQDIPTFSGWGLATDEEKRNVIADNLTYARKQINDLAWKCESNLNSGKHSEDDTAYKALFKIFEVIEDNQETSIRNNKIGEQALEYTGIKVGSAGNNTGNNWEKILTCQSSQGLADVLRKPKDVIRSKYIERGALGFDGSNTIGNLPNDMTRITNFMKELEAQFNDNPSVNKKHISNYRLQQDINYLVEEFKLGFNRTELQGLKEAMGAIKLDGKGLTTRVISKYDRTKRTAFEKENLELRKRLFILEGLKKKIEENIFITAESYCSSISRLKSCLSSYYQSGIDKFNNGKNNSDFDKSDFKDLVDEDPNHSVEGGDVISN